MLLRPKKDSTWSNPLFNLLVMVLESSSIRGILAIDNVHLISHTKRDSFFKFLTSLAETCYFGIYGTIRVVITGVGLDTITGLNKRLHVSNDTEREGKHCQLSLLFITLFYKRES